MNKKELKNDALQNLQALIKPDDTIYTVLRHVSKSGMTRYISFKFFKDNVMLTLDSDIADLLGYSQAKDGSLKVKGCGMDMGFNVVYELSCALFCPKNYDHKKAFSLFHRWI